MTRVPSERRLVRLLVTVFVVAFFAFALSLARWPLFPVGSTFGLSDLLFWTALTLLVVPALYALWFRVRRDEGVEAPAEAAPVVREEMALPIAAE